MIRGNRTIALNSGHTMPQLGLGLMRFGAQSETQSTISRALDAGYRLFDTAAIYQTEIETGEALRDGGIAREELFVTTKLWNNFQGRDSTAAAFAESLDAMGLDYLDLYLIHWPLPMFDQYVDSWRTLIELRDAGRIRSIGVSNFTEDHIERIIAETGVPPAVNQVEMHPYFQQRALRAFHNKHDIVTQAWSPLGGGGNGVPLTSDPVLTAVAAKHGRSPSQVILRWHLEMGASVIPKATSTGHLTENMQSCDLDLDGADIAAISALDRADGRFGPDPMTMDIKTF